MDNIEIKHEIFDDESSSSEESLFEYPPEVDVVIKEENELIIEDYSQEQRWSNANIDDDEDDGEQYVEYQFGGAGHFFQFPEEKEDYKDFGWLEEVQEAETHCDSKLKKSKGKPKNDVIKQKRYQLSQVYNKLKLLQQQNFIRIICPCCDDESKSFAMWVRHVNVRHNDFTEQMKSNYDFKTASRAVCKHCNDTLCFCVSHFLHYMTYHCPENHELFLCNLCNHKDSSMECIIRHIDERHQHNDVYRMCPLCAIIFPDGMLMRQHIKDAHIVEFKTKFSYICHLCNHPRFNKESHYYDHLMNVHELYGYEWELLNFKKEVGNGNQHLECIKCSKSCENTGPHKLLEHYLTHEDNCSWCCKYCDSKFQYTDSMHLCKQMYKFLNKNNISVNRPLASHTSTHHKIGPLKNNKQNWQEFESYIMHTCPFCNAEFDNFQEWQLHLRQQHYINSLKGLHMSVVYEDPEKFRCLHCDKLILKSLVDLHTHRFHHLPYMPYKCRHCSKPLENENVALKHVLNKCKSDASPLDDERHDMLTRPKLLDDDKNWIEIICSLCNNEQFSSIADIENHFRTDHNNFEENYCKSSNNLDMVCKKCKTTLRSVSSDICLSHYIKHIKDGPYKCLHCRRSYAAFEICKRHVRRFHMVTPRLKKTSKSTTSQPMKKRIHKKKSTNLEMSESKVAPNGIGTLSDKANILNEFQEFITYACAECNESFDTQILWSDHVKMQHTFFNDSELSDTSGVDGKHRCKHCNLVLDTSISHRQKHKLTHMPYKSFVCSLCYTRCNTLGPLYSHLRGVHFSKGTFECPICLVNLTTSYERSEHVNQAHPRSEWPENMCLICYRNYASLRTHMLCHDINRPKYVCPLCNGSLINFKEFQLHMVRKHNSEMATDVKPVVPTITNGAGETINVVVNKETKSRRKRTTKEKNPKTSHEVETIIPTILTDDEGEESHNKRSQHTTETNNKRKKSKVDNDIEQIINDTTIANDTEDPIQVALDEVTTSKSKRRSLRKSDTIINQKKSKLR